MGGLYNPFGAGIEIGKNNDIVAGTLLGPIRVTDEDIVETEALEGIGNLTDAIKIFISGQIV